MKSKLVIILGITIVSAAVLAVLFFKSVEQERENKSLVIAQVDSVSDSDWTKGKKNVKVSIIEYSDLQCPACLAYFPVIKQLADEFGESVNFVYRHFPLRQIHFNSQISAQAAEAAGLQGKFWEMHDILFENQQNWSEVKDPKSLFEQYAQNLSLDLEQFKKDLESNDVKNEVEKDYQSGLNAGVNATPTFFMNNKKIPNPRSLEEFKSIIKQEIEKNNE